MKDPSPKQSKKLNLLDGKLKFVKTASGASGTSGSSK